MPTSLDHLSWKKCEAVMNNITTIQSSYGSVPLYEAVPKTGRKKSAPEAVSRAGKADNVELSSSSRDFQKVHEAILQLPETRIPVVKEIKARIKINDYPIENVFNEALRKMLETGII